MAKPGLRERKNAQTAAAIERAAFELVLEQGYEHTTVDQIAERANVSPRTVYVRYGTKDAVVSVDVAESTAEFAAGLDAADGDVVERLGAHIHATMAEAHDEELGVLRLRATLTDPYLRGLFTRRLEGTAKVMRERTAAEVGLDPDDVRLYAFAAAAAGVLGAIAERALAHRTEAAVVDDLERGLGFLRGALEQLRLAA